MANPERMRSGILGGVGIRLVGGVGLSPDTIAQGLEAPSLADVSDPTAHQFRSFAEQTKSDLGALAACIRGSRQPLEREQLADIDVPILVATGTKDTVAGSGEQLAALIPRAQSLPIPDREHMLAVGDKVFKAGVLEFLVARP
jgi:pimeloyl-ACP methyl ester carboxylesterase